MNGLLNVDVVLLNVNNDVKITLFCDFCLSKSEEVRKSQKSYQKGGLTKMGLTFSLSRVNLSAQPVLIVRLVAA
jgi:hypothetical protein